MEYKIIIYLRLYSYRILLSLKRYSFLQQSPGSTESLGILEHSLCESVEKLKSTQLDSVINNSYVGEI